MPLNLQAHEMIFGPKEIATLTGLAMDAQRNWRVRGHLKSNNDLGSRLGSRAVAEVAVRAWASKLGFPPRDSLELGEAVGPSVLYWALDLTTPTPVKINGPGEKVREFFDQLQKDKNILRSLVGLPDARPAISVVWREEGPPSVLFDPDDELRHLQEDVCMRLLNLQILGAMMSDETNRPFFEITVT